MGSFTTSHASIRISGGELLQFSQIYRYQVYQLPISDKHEDMIWGNLWNTDTGWWFQTFFIVHTLCLFNIAMENSPFIDGLPIKNGDFPWLC